MITPHPSANYKVLLHLPLTTSLTGKNSQSQLEITIVESAVRSVTFVLPAVFSVLNCQLTDRGQVCSHAVQVEVE